MQQAQDWRWSSAQQHVGSVGRLTPWLVDHPDYWACGNTPFDRQARYKKAMEVFGNPVSIADANDDDDNDDVDVNDIGVLRKGSKGEGVKMMQEALGIGADGSFGPGTEKALKVWQSKNGLTADGIAGPSTLGKLLA